MIDTSDKIVTIHQPNFFPWLGYFDKIARSDVFVFLDHVQQQKTGGTWSNRVKLLVNGKACWATAPIQRAYHGVRPISEILFDDTKPWRSTILRTIEINYRKAPHYAQTMALIEPLVTSPEPRIAEYNVSAVTAIASALGLHCTILRSSDLTPSGAGTDMLISLAKLAEGTAYMCGGGASDYQDDDVFASAGIRLVYQDFRHPRYVQVGTTEFIQGLSVIDALMNCGLEGTRSLIQDAQ